MADTDSYRWMIMMVGTHPGQEVWIMMAIDYQLMIGTQRQKTKDLVNISYIS